MTALLNEREKGVIKTLQKEHKQRVSRAASRNENLVAYLGDNAERRTWSATSGRIPTFRMSGGKHWHFASKRILTGREKLATLGFPVDSETARARGVPVLPVACPKRASAVAGNCMHLGTVAVMQLLGLCCFKRID